jgi:enoyl-CoA hydratase
VPAPLLTEEPAVGVLRLALNRPEKRNAVDRAMVEALLAALRGVDAGCVVLGSVAAEAFCAGADLDLPDAERAAVSDLLYELYERMLDLPAPIVCALAGPAIGAGAQLALAADVRVAGPTARLRFPGPGHGLAVGAWGLPGLIGRGRAMELCLTMREVEAREAHAIGLVDRLADDPASAALELAAGIAALDRSAAARVKRVTYAATDGRAALQAERRANRETWTGSVKGL